MLKSTFSALKKAAEVAALSSVIITGLAFIVNVILFLVWGIRYSTVATPSDIITGAIESLEVVVPMGAAALVGKIISDQIPNNVSKAFKILIFALLFSSIICVVVLAGYHQELNLLFGYSQADVHWLLWIMGATAMLTASAIAFVKNLTMPLPVGMISWSAFVLMASLLTFSATTRKADTSILGKSERCNGLENVVWAGTAYLVTTCNSPPYTDNPKYFIVKRENQILVIREDGKKS